MVNYERHGFIMEFEKLKKIISEVLNVEEDEITMLPYGTKIYKILIKLGIYRKTANSTK